MAFAPTLEPPGKRLKTRGNRHKCNVGNRLYHSARPWLRQPRLDSDLADFCGAEKLFAAVAGIRSDAF
jgi:hypothetical protein